MYGWFDLKPLFLDRPVPERLTSNQMVSSSVFALPGGTKSPSISLGPIGRVPIFTCMKNVLFCTKAENFVPLWSPFTKLHPDIHSVCILEFHGKVVVRIQN